MYFVLGVSVLRPTPQLLQWVSVWEAFSFTYTKYLYPYIRLCPVSAHCAHLDTTSHTACYILYMKVQNEWSRWCSIIPGNSVNAFCPQCVCAQYQAWPPINRPPPSATNCWISSPWSSLYAVHTNTLRSFLKFVFSHCNPDALRTLRA